MIDKIALEEHLGAENPNILDHAAPDDMTESWSRVRAMLLDIHEQRLGLMDEFGIEKCVLSLTQPGIQGLHDTAQAIDWAARINDYTAEQVARRPDRFAAFGAVPMQDPDAAVSELRRAVKELGMVGAMINGFSQIGSPENAVYLDDERYEPFWAEVESLGVPIYLHARNPLRSRSPEYEGHPWLYGAAWGFGVETATHAMRLMASGLFDRYPGATVILGHLGEMLPYAVWRIDHRFSLLPRGLPARQPFAYYLRNNFYITTSGNFRTPALIDAMLEVGVDRILFSCDYPYEDMGEAARWFDSLSLGDEDLEKIGRLNAQNLLRLM